MTDLEHEIEQDQRQTVRVIETRKAISPHHLTRCVCGGMATTLFRSTIGSKLLEQRFFCKNCDPIFIVVPIAPVGYSQEIRDQYAAGELRQSKEFTWFK